MNMLKHIDTLMDDLAISPQAARRLSITAVAGGIVVVIVIVGLIGRA